MSHLLVTNDFPPKVGGIQTYLWELWRRLPAGEVTVLTSPHPGSAAFDAAAPMPVVRTREPVLLPLPGMAGRIRRLAAEHGASLVVLDPALPLGAVGPRLGLPYAVVVHGAEVAVPGRLPIARPLLGRVLRGARGVVAAGGYPAAEARHALAFGRRCSGLPAACGPEVVVIPPGVDLDRFRPLDEPGRRSVRTRLGLPETGLLVVSTSRLVPRKGMDVLVESLTRLVVHRPDLTLAIAGAGRDLARLRTLAGRLGVTRHVRFLGRVPDADLADLCAAADVYAMACRNRWGGLEQEGFGIVFLEAAAAGVAQVAGRSGGSADAVVDGDTGLVVDRPDDPAVVAAALGTLLDDPERRATMGVAARQRAEDNFGWDWLATQLGDALRSWSG